MGLKKICPRNPELNPVVTCITHHASHNHLANTEKKNSYYVMLHPTCLSHKSLLENPESSKFKFKVQNHALPFGALYTFDNTGKRYDVSRVINSDFSFNLQAAYKTYSPLLLPHLPPFPTGFRLHPSRPPSPMPSFTTANGSGIKFIARSRNNLISTPASCPCTRRSRIGGT